MKKIALILSLACLSLACAKEAQNPDSLQEEKQVNLQQVTLVAGQEVATKTDFNKDTGALTWKDSGEESDMAIFDGSAKQLFTHGTTTDGGTQATFSGTADVSTATWVAVHPASHAALDGANILVTFPCFQTIESGGGMQSDVNTMAAQVTHDGSSNLDHFTMKNVGGLLKLTVAKAGIKTITVSSRGGEPLTGTATLTFDGEGNPVLTPVSTKYETFVTLCAANMATGIPTGDYFVNVFPVTMTTGLIIDMENIDGIVASVKSSTAATVARSADLEFAGFDTGASWYEPETTTMTLNFKNVTWPFVETTNSSASNENAKKWKGNTEKQLTYSPDNSILFYINCSDLCSANGGNGLRFGKGNGDYLLFPALPGKNLVQVKVKYVATKEDKTRPAIYTRGGNETVIGGTAIGSNIISGSVGSEAVETWNLVGTAHNMQYRYQLTGTATDVSYIDQIDLTYASKTPPIEMNLVFWKDTGVNGSQNQPFKTEMSDYTAGGEETFQFTCGDVDYDFVLGVKHRMRNSLQNRGYGLDSGCYIKLPAIAGYKLAAVSATCGGSSVDKDSEVIEAKTLYISTTSSYLNAISGGTMVAAACTQSSPSSFSASLTTTSANTSYYIVNKNAGWIYIRNLRLVYAPVAAPAPAPAPASLLDGGETEL